MKLVFPNKTDFETNIIIDFLNQENIRYKTKLVRSGITDIYDIEIDTSYEYYMFIQKLAKEKLEPYLIAMRSFCLPSYEPDKNKNIPVTTEINGFTFTFTPFEEPKHNDFADSLQYLMNKAFKQAKQDFELATKEFKKDMKIEKQKESSLLKLMKKWKWIK